jgi:hypothetical protein
MERRCHTLILSTNSTNGWRNWGKAQKTQWGYQISQPNYEPSVPWIHIRKCYMCHLAWQWALWTWNKHNQWQFTYCMNDSCEAWCRGIRHAVLGISWDACCWSSAQQAMTWHTVFHKTVSSDNTTSHTSENVHRHTITGHGVRSIHLHLVPRLRMSGLTPLCPLYTFMEWAGKTLLVLPFMEPDQFTGSKWRPVL